MNYYFEHLLTSYKDIWYSLDNFSINDLPNHAVNRKVNDKELITMKKKMLQITKQQPNLKSFDTPENQATIRREVQRFIVDVLEIDAWACDVLFEDGYYNATKEFTKRASDLIDMPFEDIYQALRNVWVMNSLQVYLQVPIRLTDPVFGYSMLYPLTDNYLDDPTIPKHEKKSFNKRFYQKIKFDIDEPANDSESLIFSMIDLIANDFDRSTYPKVYDSLLAILDGQNKSLDQQGLSSLYDQDILSYTFYKGGSSVLADAYLVKGSLSLEEEMFAYGYGVILQIADDMQDICDDMKNAHMTMPNAQSQYSNLDGLYCRYEALISHFFTDIYKPFTKQQEALYQILRRSVELLSFGGVYMNKSFFSKKLYRQVLSKGYFSKKAYNKYNKKIIGSIALR